MTTSTQLHEPERVSMRRVTGTPFRRHLAQVIVETRTFSKIGKKASGQGSSLQRR